MNRRDHFKAAASNLEDLFISLEHIHGIYDLSCIVESYWAYVRVTYPHHRAWTR